MSNGNPNKNIQTFYEALVEILKIAQYSINLFKPDNINVHGYPAAILLATFIEAMGHNFGFKKKEYADTYKILKDKDFYNYGYLTDKDCKSIYSTFRNPLSHHAILDRKCQYLNFSNMHVNEDLKEAIMISEDTISLNLKRLLLDSERLLKKLRPRIPISTNFIETGEPLTANRNSNLKSFHEAIGTSSEITLTKGSSANLDPTS